MQKVKQLAGYYFNVHFSHLPLIKSKRDIDHAIKVMFGNFRNSGARKKMAIGRL